MNGKRYTDEFKIEAVKQAVDIGAQHKTITEQREA